MTKMPQGPAATLEEVVRSYADMVYRLAYAYMRSASDADDVFQDVFLRYAEKAPVFREEAHRRAWLLRVTINRCRSHYRSSWYRRIAPMEAAANAASPAPADPLLDNALTQLPVRYRTIIHLYYFENYDTSEIAVITGQQPSTVRAQLTRARHMLRTLLKGDSHDLS